MAKKYFTKISEENLQKDIAGLNCQIEEDKNKNCQVTSETFSFNLRSEKRLIQTMVSTLHKLNKEERYVNYIKCIDSL